MKQLVTLFVMAVTIIPMLLFSLLVSPFGWADDVAEGYSNWLTDSVCNCREK